MVKRKFVEGQSYQFRYVKKVSLDEDFFVFEDFAGERYLIPAYYYKNYGFEYEALINCTVTRIDCSGKVSLEPEHPFYKLGSTYDFHFKGLDISEEEDYNKYSGSFRKRKVYELIVLDIYGNEHTVSPYEWQKRKNYHPRYISCRILKIIKGHFQLINNESVTEPRKKRLGFFNGNL
ncbi:MAG: hypothetical protein B6I20_10415 [Bacteroidetes bacterium 4572_117]|nr:MAG: hypothetical protein B6I20_10415 [Bacteroidetes bacterium 4572_117]